MSRYQPPLGWAPIAAAMLLVGVAIDRVSQPKPADAREYHQRVQTAAAGIPLRFGNWNGKDVAVPRAAIKMLSPNVIISRRYVNIADGHEVNVLLVQCGDARDIVAHYPPNCYRGGGWTLTQSTPRHWLARDMTIDGTEYHFIMNSFDRMGSLTIDNFMILPNGHIVPDMNAVNLAAGDVRRRYFGAAQIQVIFQDDLPVDRRDEIFSEFVAAMYNTIVTIRSGDSR